VRVFVGSDHAGFELKGHLLRELAKAGHDVVDVGPEEFDPVDDYPPYCVETGRRTVATPEALGVVIGGSGNGEQIAANKVPGIRAALAWNIETAKLARQHNNAQIVAIGARQHSLDEAAELAAAFVAEPFSEDPRHQRRIDELAKYEKTHEPPALPNA
jgi:ribose 5-phosphate isomerase B